jgi:hypothetical protein
MCVCVYVYVYVSMYVFQNVVADMRRPVCMYECVYVCMYECVHVCMCIDRSVHACVYVYMCIDRSIHVLHTELSVPLYVFFNVCI